jgi:hypothetical protein
MLVFAKLKIFARMFKLTARLMAYSIIVDVINGTAAGRLHGQNRGYKSRAMDQKIGSLAESGKMWTPSHAAITSLFKRYHTRWANERTRKVFVPTKWSC